MTAKQITHVLLTKWLGSRAAIPNYMGRGSNGESDLFLVTGSAYCEEVEIKVSMADFRREFRAKHFKHGCLTNHPTYDFTRTNKHYLFPRRFWFAVPSSIVDKVLSELTGPYGLLEVTPTAVLERVKPKAIPGARKLTEKELIALAKCMTFRIVSALAANSGVEPFSRTQENGSTSSSEPQASQSIPIQESDGETK